MASLHKWDSFLWTGDEFILGYATSPINSSAAPLFMIGQAVELYLKAANTKITGDIDRAVGFGHRMKDLWNDCKQKDSTFMPSYELKDSIFNKAFLEENIDTLYSKPDCLEYLHNQDFYLIAKHLMDIKYFGAPLKSIKKPYSYTFVSHNPYWIDFFKELRAFLEYPMTGANDHILIALEMGDIGARGRTYLEGLYK